MAASGREPSERPLICFHSDPGELTRRFSSAQVADMQAQALAMANCLRAHGVPNFPDPMYTSQPGGNFLPGFSSSTCKLDTTSPAFVAAVKMCPSGPGGNFAPTFIRAQQENGAACAS